MQKTSFFPPFIRTLSVLFIGTLLALVLARGAMLGILWPEVAGNPASDILNALYIGTKFDIRMVYSGSSPLRSSSGSRLLSAFWSAAEASVA